MMKTFFGLLLIGFLLTMKPNTASAAKTVPWWQFQSIDTMKHSRDNAQQYLTDLSYDQTIDYQVSQIANAGATHVAIATPYDEDFYPYLKRWVDSARRHDLNVWFRGNFSGWEQWFGFSRIDRDEHKRLLISFLETHPDLFKDGDAFSSCPECENGGPGDPRMNNDVAGHRRFLIEEYLITRDAFHRMGKNVTPNLHSMNADVARLVMDEETTKDVGGYVVIDHYVKDADQLVSDVREIAQQSKGKIILGEIGAPIPDIHGNMTEEEQARWIDRAFAGLAMEKDVVGVSYWVNNGGSTRLWNDDGTPRQAVSVVQKHFAPPAVYGKVVTQKGRPIANATVKTPFRISVTDKNGVFLLALSGQEQPTVAAFANGYVSETVPVDANGQQNVVIALESDRPTLWQKIWGWIADRFTV